VPLLASDIFAGARALLNDTADEKYHDADLLPLLQIVYGDFLLSLDNNDIPSLDEISAITTVLAGATTITLPSDFKTPIKLVERALGSTSTFNEVFPRAWEPEAIPSQMLLYWTYREDTVQVLPATTDREVKLYYVKDLTIQGASSSIPILYADVVLKYALGSIAAEDIGENYVRADRLGSKMAEALQKFLSRRVKGRQAFPVRRPAFRERRRVSIMYR
jgi:hypothetical protein